MLDNYLSNQKDNHMREGQLTLDGTPVLYAESGR